MDEEQLREKVDMVNLLITQRLSDQARSQTRPDEPLEYYTTDWRVIAGARCMALLYAANDRRLPMDIRPSLPLYVFYNSLVDYVDLTADFDSWQGGSGEFSFCQYPALLSLGAKMRIVQFDALRQQDERRKQALQVYNAEKRIIPPYLLLQVRRDHLVADSLDQLALVKDFKKKLRIQFVGEPGIDAGGLTKEWFQLLVRDLFSPSYGMFSYEAESHLVWFNPYSFEAENRYYLIGVVMGLAIYNSTILDIPLPPVAYKKLLSHPGSRKEGGDRSGGSTTSTTSLYAKEPLPVLLEDLEAWRPSLARGLRQLLDYEPAEEVEDVFCRDFVAEYEQYGERIRTPLCPGGEDKSVTGENRVEYVRLMCLHLLHTSVSRQFEPFALGFHTVCGGNALSLFRPEEVELLVRGSEEPLNTDELASITEYDGFTRNEATIRAFWQVFREADPAMQRRILTFITGSDRLPAAGTVAMRMKITNLGPDTRRLPQAHTCFNQLCLYEYGSREVLQYKLSQAVHESEGFGLK